MAIRKLLPTEFNSDAAFFSTIVGRVELEVVTQDQLISYFLGKRILVIGAGGTIGSAVARRILSTGLKDVFFLDRDESSLHALALSLSNSAASHSEKCLVADVKDLLSLRQIMMKYKPDIVIHAAALKHLVILERFPREGYTTNIMGTLNVLQACSEAGVGQVINISTDKAANPTSILGMTKRVAEVVVEEFNSNSEMICSSVRFGNVFASRGSVIETFVHQLQNSLPVTLTDLDVTRFFMSHDEAANLILASGMLGESGVFVQKMGDRVRMKDVIDRLASAINAEVDLQIIGLQSGEKLHEDLYEDNYRETKFESIVQVSIPVTLGLRKMIQDYGIPVDDAAVREMIWNLMSRIKSNGEHESRELSAPVSELRMEPGK